MIETERLVLRSWRESDREPFARMCSDPEVMAHFPALLSPQESDAMIDHRIGPHFDAHGFGFWAVERICDGSFLGFTGVARVSFACPIEDEIEIGWRLAREAWGQGYATEAARAAAAYAFSTLKVPRIVAMTITANSRSRRVMEKLGLKRAPHLDFDHPWIPEGSPVRPQIVYVREAG